MTPVHRTLIKEAHNLVWLCNKLDNMRESSNEIYDILDFMQIEKEIKEEKELLIMKIGKL